MQVAAYFPFYLNKTNLCRHHERSNAPNVTTLTTMRIMHISTGFKTLHDNRHIWCPNSSIIDHVFCTSRWNLKYTTHHFYHCIYGLSTNVPKKFRKTPSNARIFPKVFRRSRFWTSFMSIFWKFFDSCANLNRRNNNFNLYNTCVIIRPLWSHKGLTKKNMIFGPKNDSCNFHAKCIVPILCFKTDYRQ